MFKVNKPEDKYCYKYGIDDMQPLKSAMLHALVPIQLHLQKNIYWSNVCIDYTEYKSRDGFIPHSSNCGGVEICEIIPRYELYDFTFIPVTECWEPNEKYEGDLENHECDEHCNHKLRVWFKFEGLDDKGNGMFWLYCGGGNGDAPYFRVEHEQDIFEHSFKAKNVADFKIKAKKAVSKLLKVMS